MDRGRRLREDRRHEPVRGGARPRTYPRTYGAKPGWQRALVIVAGPATHFVLAFLCFAVWLALVGEQPEASDVAIAKVGPVCTA